MSPEAKVKKKVRDLLVKHGVYYFTPQSGGYGKSGVADVVVCACGHFVSIECKRDDKHQPTALQTANYHAVEEAGGISYIVNADNFDTWAAGFTALLSIWKNNKDG